MPLSALLRRAGAVALASGLVFVGAGTALSCGYHSPVAVQRGMLNWIYPNALHVRTAVWQGEQAGILPARPPVADLFGYHKAVANLQHLRAALQDGAAENPPPAFSIVFIDTMLWSRFAPGEGFMEVQIHRDGPEPDDLVVVSEETVIAAVVAGKMQVKDAVEWGLLRLYGDPDTSARWLRTMRVSGRH